jgi:release factor glutamine methyltransferase
MASSQSSTKISAKKLLAKYNKQLPSKELDLLLALAWHKNIEYIYKHPEANISVATTKTFNKLARKRLAGWSMAYLKGYKEFFGYKFLVNKHTLIPRPDSELIVEQVLTYLKKSNIKQANIIDIGTGSGCLISSIAKNYPNAKYTAVDISIKALQIARTNARKLGLKTKIKFLKSNLFKKIRNQTFDIIIANLPYLTPKQLQEPSIKKEPRVALLAGSDGLSYYRKFLEQVPKYLNKQYLILLEIDPSQKDLIQASIEVDLPQAKIKFIKDLAGHVRVVKITN